MKNEGDELSDCVVKCSLDLLLSMILKNNPGLCDLLPGPPRNFYFKHFFELQATMYYSLFYRGKMGEIARFLWELQGFQIIVEKITEVQCHWKKHIFNLPVIFSLIGTLVPLSKPF